MTGFGFVEFENSRDAEDALNAFNGKSFMGTNIVVEFAKESRPKRDTYEADRAPRTRRPPGFRLIVSGISRDTSWQDLKDFGREAGSVSFADIDRDNVGDGILEYLTREDSDRAVKQLDGKELRGQSVRVVADNDTKRGPDNYRRDDRRGDREDRYNRDDRRGGGGGGGDRGGDRHDRYRGGDDRPPYRRNRSRSPPPRRDQDERRPPRSPPPKRDYDDKRPAGDEDRPRRDDRRRDDKDDRYEGRPPRYADGDAAFSR